MNFPVIISDIDGRIVYKSRSVNSEGFLTLFDKIKGRGNQSGLVVLFGNTYYYKHISLCGRKYIIVSSYKNFDFARCRTDNVLDEVFDIKTMSQERVCTTLENLSEVFAKTYVAELFKEGVRVVIHKIVKSVVIDVPPKLFVLSLALMAKLLSCDTGSVRFSFANECGRVTVYVDSDKDRRSRRKEDEVLEFMLYEAAAKAGFELEKTENGVASGYSLSLSPLDVSLLGLKVPNTAYLEEVCKFYAAIFL